jgi:RNA polymerase sigma-70 factor (ECF subfamily)
MENKMSKYPNDPEQMMWIALAKDGSSTAFNHIVEKYQQPVYNFCYRMLNNRDDAEDAAQEVFMRAYFKLDSYAEPHKFSTWLFSIASHYCIDRFRKRRLPLVSWDDFDPWDHFPNQNSPQPEGTLVKAEADREVQVLLDALPPNYRTVIILKYWHMMSYQEIAQTLGTTVSTIKSRLFRAKKAMAAQAAEPHRRDAAKVPNRMVFNSPRDIAQLGIQ